MKLPIINKRVFFRKRIYLLLFFILAVVMIHRTHFKTRYPVEMDLTDLDTAKIDQILIDFQTPLIDKDTAGIDYVKLGNRLRIFKRLWSISVKQPDSSEPRILLKKLESMLFPWLHLMYPSLMDLIGTFHGSGIVICSGDAQAKLTISTILMIRTIHKSQIPIEVFYAGNQDLSKEWRSRILEIPNTKVVDITNIFDNQILGLKGWSIKPFATLASSFENVILMDSDVVFFQNPERLFTTDFYKTYNTIFFHDRSLFKSPLKTLDWFYDLMPKPPSAYSQSFRIFHRKTAHEQESGVVVINKKHSFMGILAACVFNVKSFRGHTYQYVFGDKETFWLGFEVVQQPYHFFPRLPGNIGSHVVKNSKYQVCSRQILHFDQKGKPLWVNGGLKESKYEKSSMAVMKEYVKEPGDWDLLTGGNLACLTTSSKPIPITAELLDIIRSSGSIIDSIID